jgi:cytochrome c oxidase subunit III
MFSSGLYMRTSSSSTGQKAGGWDHIAAFHPHKMLIILSVIGSSLLFLFMLVALTSTLWSLEDPVTIRMPRFFTISAFLILISSFFLLRVPPAFRQDDMDKVVLNLRWTLVLGLGFGLCQMIGWWELDISGITLAGTTLGSYIYVLSGLHLLHMLGGMLFLMSIYRRARRVKPDTVASFIYLANPYEKVKLDMLNIWWHFMDLLWLVLFFYFLWISG